MQTDETGFMIVGILTIESLFAKHLPDITIWPKNHMERQHTPSIFIIILLITMKLCHQPCSMPNCTNG